MKGEEAKSLERKHVYSVYDQIAPHFSGTRYKPWPSVHDFVLTLPANSVLIDVGCGNGKHLGLRGQMFEMGVDLSEALVKIARNRKKPEQEPGLYPRETLVGDCVQLPFRDGIADACICIAVLHHLATEERRVAALKEILRLLAAGGRALIYVWAFEQQLKGKKSFYVKSNEERRHFTGDFVHESGNLFKGAPSAVPSSQGNGTTTANSIIDNNNPSSDDGSSDVDSAFLAHKEFSPSSTSSSSSTSKTNYDNQVGGDEQVPNDLPIHQNRSEFKAQDILVPWKNRYDKKVYHRYYHVFKQWELENLISSLPNVQILESYYVEGNWGVLIQRDCC